MITKRDEIEELKSIIIRLQTNLANIQTQIHNQDNLPQPKIEVPGIHQEEEIPR
jgi:hypothetical protein